MVYCITFASMLQVENKPIQQYLVHLRAMARDCSCLYCEHDLPNIYIKVQLIRGTANDTLQMDLLAKAGILKSLE